MKKFLAAALFAVTGMALPSVASAGCYSCAPAYQQQVVPPQYRTVERTVMVAPGHTVRRHRPAQYRTVMVPRTVMVAPPRTEYRRIPAQYATQQSTVMVAPAQVYYAPVQQGCSTCNTGFNFGSSHGASYGYGASQSAGYGYSNGYGYED
jgi:hypothetical protein